MKIPDFSKAVLIAASLVVLAASAPSRGAEALGDKTCEAWTTARRTNNAEAYVPIVQWVLGYLRSAVDSPTGTTGHDPLRGLPRDRATAWLDDYCAGNPLATVNQAASDLYKETLERSKRG